MNTNLIAEEILNRAKKWTLEPFDQETRTEVTNLIQNNPTAVTDAFYRDLEFGTGGLRGIMGPGTNRMNRYTVGMATQGLANYLKKNFSDRKQISVAISYDSRNNNTLFADTVASVLTGNNIKVFLSDTLRPTPELSFAIRHLGCESGIMITASHNPKEYNGYKVYWEDGAQVIPPHDEGIIDEVRKISSVNEVIFEANPSLITSFGEEVDRAYLAEIIKLSLSPEAVKKQAEMKIVYTAIHGTGTKLTPAALASFGFKNIIPVEAQMIPDGNFPTVHSPNPEEPAALAMAIKLAKEEKAALVMATDPDADRVGIAVPDDSGEFILLNGNQTASLLLYYLINRYKELGTLPNNSYIIKTIVTTELLADMAKNAEIPCFDVLTGFKYIAGLIREREHEHTYLFGGEESYGYLFGDFVRDKDAVSACCMIAETAAWAATRGQSMLNLLEEIYQKYGLYIEGLLSITRPGKTGADEIIAMMAGYRQTPPTVINGSKVIRIIDYKSQQNNDLLNNTITVVNQPISDVIQFFTADGTKITVRPSGTEPKIKFYFGVKVPIEGTVKASTEKALHQIELIKKEMNLI